MSWILPSVASIPAGGAVRCVGTFNRRAYDRAYYHAKRRGRKQDYTLGQLRRRYAQRSELYRANPERERANARARYWKNREKYAAAARERARVKSQQRRETP